MIKDSTRCCLTKITVALFATAATLLTPAFANATQMSWVKGGNWADVGDNFQTGLIIPCGLTSSSTVAQAKSKADQIASNLAYVGGNFVRIGINPPSVADGTWWPVMQAYINELVAKGFYVDLACWGSSSSKGTIDNFSAWETMWETVDSVYSGNWNIWYEPFNEPHGYSTTALLNNVYAPFLTIVTKSQQRIILDGTGYSDHIAAVGADSRFTTCKLGLHDYGFWDTSLTTESQWINQFNGEVNGYQDRAVITEMGAPATTGLNYRASANNCYISFIRGVLTRANQLGIGVVYWPSHRDGDSYRLFVDTTSGAWTNWSLMTELQSLW
jgi:hypothetical protein